jgi:hypothetical protein
MTGTGRHMRTLNWLAALSVGAIAGFVWLWLNSRPLDHAEPRMDGADAGSPSRIAPLQMPPGDGPSQDAWDASFGTSLLIPPNSRVTAENDGVIDEVMRGASHTGQGLSGARAESLARQREWAKRTFPEVASVLQLDGRTADRLMDLVARHALESLENAPRIPDGGSVEFDEYDKPQWVRDAEALQEALQRRHNEEMIQFLGEEKFRLWRNYVQGAEARRLARQLQARLIETEDPVSDAQLPSFVEAIVNRQEQFASDSAVLSFATGLERLTKHHDRLREAGQPYLSPRQRAEFDRMLNEQLDRERKRVSLLTSQPAR